MDHLKIVSYGPVLEHILHPANFYSLDMPLQARLVAIVLQE